MNAYSTKFFCRCPNNDARIEYALRIETSEAIAVEQIIDGIELDADEPCFHEELADLLLARFGGTQTLTADHHGVTIETTRAALPKAPGEHQ